MTHFADRLADAVRAKGNALCVGLDPRWESLPAEIRMRHGGESLQAVAAAYEEFCGRVLDVVAPLVPVVKPQSAFFEACGPDGMAAMQRLLRKARGLGLLTILDAKRNDIASTAAAYADAAFAGVELDGRVRPVWEADALTVNPYLGRDAVEPFLHSARKAGAGVFVLVRTSNPGAGLFQDLVADGKPVYVHVAEAVAAWARENMGRCGLGDVGAVVGATYPAELAALRRLAPHVPFLVPGYGAQGGGAADVAPAFRPDGLGAVVNSSRGVLFPFKPDDPAWERCVEEAARAAVAELAPLATLRMVSGAQEDVADPLLHPIPTRRSGYRYLFSSKHHGGGAPGDARWSPSVSRVDEFSVFDAADFHDLSDERQWMYGVLRSEQGEVRDLGTWNQQIAEFPLARPGTAWHGYPLWPLGELAPPNRRGEKFRPSKAVFQKMESSRLITARERKRLYKGDHL